MTLGLGGLLVILTVTAFFGKKGVMDIRRARRDLRALSGEVERLKGEKARLEREIERLENDPQAIEKLAREKFWLIKPGEKVVVLPEKKD